MKYTKLSLKIIFALFLAFVPIWLIANTPKFQFFGDLVYRVDTHNKVVALTFDDGPSPNNTEAVLSLLKEHSIPATFFMIGKNIEKYPEIAKQVQQSGHQIANHTYSHQRTLFSSVDFFKEEILKTDNLIRGLGYNDRIIFRPPFGKKLFSLPLALKDLNKTTVTWDADSQDTQMQDPEALLQKVLSKIQPGSIILFHDGFARKDGTIEAVRRVIENLKSQDYQFVSVNDLIDQSKQE